MASHYVCTGGCLTIQYSPGKCRIKTCVRFRNPLTECRCRNGKHGELLYKNHPDRDNILKSLKTAAKTAK